MTRELSPLGGPDGAPATAARVDATVVEADVKFRPTPGWPLTRSRRWPAAARLRGLAGAGARRVADRGRAVKGRSRRLGRSLKRRTEEAKQDALELTGECGELLAKTVAEARRLHAFLARGTAAQTAAAASLEQLLGDCERIAEEVRQRPAGEPIRDRLVSLYDRDAGPICKGVAGRTESGDVQQICEVTVSTRGAAAAPAACHRSGQPGEDQLLRGRPPSLTSSASRHEFAFDGGSGKHMTIDAISDSGEAPDTVYIAGPASPSRAAPAGAGT